MQVNVGAMSLNINARSKQLMLNRTFGETTILKGWQPFYYSTSIQMMDAMHY